MVKRCKFASKFIQIIWHLYLPLSFFFQSKFAALCTHSEGKSLLRVAWMHAPPRPWGKWLPRPAPAPKIFKTARPGPENAPSLTLTPPQPEIFFFCPTRPVAKNAASCILVHNCTIFLYSLDIGNIVQGGDPLYASLKNYWVKPDRLEPAPSLQIKSTIGEPFRIVWVTQ